MQVHLQYKVWNEIPFPLYGGKPYSGRHWRIEGSINKVADAGSAWKTLKSAFLAKGWSIQTEFPDPGDLFATVHFAENRLEAWANVEIVHANNIRIDVLEPSLLPYTLVLPAPGSKPERIDAAKGDFASVPPLPGSNLSDSRPDPGPFVVTIASTDQPEMIATGSVVKSYRAPEGVSGAMFIAEYLGALANAGWSILSESPSMDASIVAHNTRGHRNLWAKLLWKDGDYQIQIAEPASKHLAKAISASCHVALYGVLFDFSAVNPGPPSSLTVSPSEINGSPGDTFTYTAATTSSVPGSFYWRVVKKEETDDPSAYTLTGPSCAGQTTCTATARGNHPGFANVDVSFHQANATEVMQAESAPMLRQILALLKHNRRLQVELQGHTDNAGTDAYNQMLADSQAAEVVTWLTQNGIAAKRLTSKGYGSAKPVADNSADVGRAMNHRLEIANRRCVSRDR